MSKKLPSVFAGNILDNAAHNQNVNYGEKDNKIEENIESSNLNINQKISAIFSSSRYVYKADVEIKMKDQTIKRRIIGRNSIHLITIDNELISISDIIDIKFIN